MAQIKNFLTRIIVMFIFLVNVETSLVNSALGEITKAFPGVGPTLISMISTLPILVMFLMSFAISKLMNRYDKKTLAFAALMLYAVGGIGGFFLCSGIVPLLCTRIVLGIGAGIAAPLSGAIIAELYSGSERAHMYGMTNAMGSIMGTLITMLGGVLMMIHWNYIFLGYGLFFIIALLVFFVLPSMPPVQNMSQSVTKVTFQPAQKKRLCVMAVYEFFCLVACMCIMIKIAIYISQHNLGTPILAATAFTVFTLSTLVVSLLYGFVVKLIKRYVLVVAPLFAAIAYVILLVGNSLTAVFAAMVFVGIANGLSMPGIQMEASQLGDEQQGAKAISVVFGAMFLGNFCASFIQAFLGLFGITTVEGTFGFCIGLLIFVSLLYLVSLHTIRDRQAAPQP